MFLYPLCSLSCLCKIFIVQPFFSANFLYISKRILTQSSASSPPAPAKRVKTASPLSYFSPPVIFSLSSPNSFITSCALILSPQKSGLCISVSSSSIFFFISSIALDYTLEKSLGKHQGCGILLENMPEPEIKGETKSKHLTLSVLALLALLVFILMSQSFSAKAKKQKTETSFNYAPTAAATTPEPEISALSYLGAYLGEDGKTIILAEKNSEDLLPMASLTKLMTAIVAYKNYDLEDEITMGPKVNDWPDSSKRFIPGTVFKISELLRALLIESNNDAAMALAGKMGLDNFVAMMNGEAKELGIITTYYDNPVGFDPTSKKEIINYSTAKELLILAREIINNYPQILEITSFPKYDIKTSSGGYNHTAISTD